MLTRSASTFARVIGLAASIDGVDRGDELGIPAGRLRVPVMIFGLELPTPTLPEPIALCLWFLWVLGGLLLIAGRRSIGAAVVLATSALVLALDQQHYSNHTVLIASLCLLITLTGSSPNLAVMIRAQISIVYVFAALSKLRSPWWSGDILRQSADGPLGLVVARDLPDASLTAVAVWVIALELSLAVLIWKGGPAVLAMAALFHLGVIVVVGNQIGLWVFAIAMLAHFALPHFALPPPASTRKRESIPPSPTPAR